MNTENLKLNLLEVYNLDDICKLVFESFAKGTEYSDGVAEEKLVREIVSMPYYIPELTFVAEIDGEAVGFCMLSKFPLSGKHEDEFLILAPVAVDYRYLRRGIGKRMLTLAIEKAKNMGFKGIVISQPPRDVTPSEREAFIFDIKKDLLGMDMLLFCEAEGDGHDQNHDAADAVIVFYEKCNRSEIPSFENGERQVYERYAEGNDSGKAFIELSSFGYDGEKPLTIEQIQKIAIKYGAEFKNDDEKGISILSYNQYKNGKGRKASICFENLDNTKAKLALMHELGFMGAAFDVGRVPISFIMMLYTTFTGIEYGLSEAFDF